MKLSEKIIRLRKGRGLSQEELAERLGVSRQAGFPLGKRNGTARCRKSAANQPAV